MLQQILNNVVSGRDFISAIRVSIKDRLSLLTVTGVVTCHPDDDS